MTTWFRNIEVLLHFYLAKGGSVRIITVFFVHDGPPTSTVGLGSIIRDSSERHPPEVID